jgi:hypothetical protein
MPPIKPIPAYNAETGATTGKPSAEYNTYLKSLNSSPRTQQTPINAEIIGNTTPLNIPEPDTSITTSNLSLANNSATSGVVADSTAEMPTTDASAGKNTLKKYAEKVFGDLSGTAAEEEKIRKEQDVQTKKERAVAVANELDVMDKNFRDEVKTIKENFHGSPAGLQAATNAAQDMYENRRANVALTYKVLNQDAQGAEEIVTQKIASLEKRNNQELQAYNIIKDLVYDDLTASEKIIADEQSRLRTDKAKTTTDFYATTLANAVQNRAPASILSAIDEASRAPGATAATIAVAAGKYGVNAVEAAQLRNINSQIADRAEDAKRKLTELPGPVQTRVQGVAGQFDSEPLIKTFNQIGQQKAFIDSIPNNTENPSDDQALIYAFAKIMDPDSVVREGEYATVKKYSQSWAKAYGKGIDQALNGTGFLSEDARANIKKTVDSRYNIAKKTYDNTYEEYGRRIDKITGGSDGKDYITDYSAAFSDKSAAPTVTPEDLSKGTVSGLNLTIPGLGSFTFPDQKSFDQFKKDHNIK